MAAMFYILAFLLYVRGRLAKKEQRRWPWFLGCAFAGMLALGSKEIAATLPFFILLYEWYFFQELSMAWLKGHLPHIIGALILLGLLTFLYLGSSPLEEILSGYQYRGFTLAERVLTEFRVVIFYISLLIFVHPSRLNLDYDFPLSRSLFEPMTTLLSIVAIGGLIGLALYMAKKERLMSFCILWFLGNLVIESCVIGLEIVFEHRTYLPSMLVSLMAVTLAYRYAKPKWLTVVALCALTMVLSIWTYQRNSVWSEDVTLWRDCVEKSPKKARPHNNLGNALAKQGSLNEAIHHYSEALKINPNLADTHKNLGATLHRQGKLEEAVTHFSHAVRIKPDYAEAHNNLGATLHRQGKLEEAIAHYSEALRIKPDYTSARRNLSLALRQAAKHEEGLSTFTAP